MVTAGIFPFKENSHGRAGNRTRDLMISSHRLWPLDHEAGLNAMKVNTCFLPLRAGPIIGYLYWSIRLPATNLMRLAGCCQLSTRLSERLVSESLSKWPRSVRVAENAGSNTAGGMDVCLLRVLCVVRYRSLRRFDHSSRGVLASVIVKPR